MVEKFKKLEILKVEKLYLEMLILQKKVHIILL